MTSELPKTSVAETLAEKIVALKAGRLPAATTRKCEDLLIDIVGLCVTARNEDYVASALAGWDEDGPCTAIGHQRTLNAAGAAFVNGTAAHGEDFDDTFEGGPVHAGAVIVPAVLAACERHNPDGRMALTGIAVGTEVLCRLSLVVPKAVHKAGFHPTAVFGAMGAAAGVARPLASMPNRSWMRSASPAAWRAASSSISPRARGPSGCMRAGRAVRHPGGAAAGRGLSARAPCSRACMACSRLRAHGERRLRRLTATSVGAGSRIRWPSNPIPVGPWRSPISIARDGWLARGIRPEEIREIVCEVAEGTVHRLWEPLADKQRPRNGYAAKCDAPYLLATGFSVVGSDFGRLPRQRSAIRGAGNCRKGEIRN